MTWERGHPGRFSGLLLDAIETVALPGSSNIQKTCADFRWR